MHRPRRGDKPNSSSSSCSKACSSSSSTTRRARSPSTRTSRRAARTHARRPSTRSPDCRIPDLTNFTDLHRHHARRQATHSPDCRIPDLTNGTDTTHGDPRLALSLVGCTTRRTYIATTQGDPHAINLIDTTPVYQLKRRKTYVYIHVDLCTYKAEIKVAATAANPRSCFQQLPLGQRCAAVMH